MGKGFQNLVKCDNFRQERFLCSCKFKWKLSTGCAACPAWMRAPHVGNQAQSQNNRLRRGAPVVTGLDADQCAFNAAPMCCP